MPHWKFWTIGKRLKEIVQDAYTLHRPEDCKWYDLRQWLLFFSVRIFPFDIPATAAFLFAFLTTALTTSQAVQVTEPFLWIFKTTKTVIVPKPPSNILVGLLVFAFYVVAFFACAKLLKKYMLWDCRRIVAAIEKRLSRA